MKTKQPVKITTEASLNH